MEGGASTFPITSAMLDGVTDMFGSAITVAAPVGIAVLAIYIGVRAVPKLIKMIGRG